MTFALALQTRHLMPALPSGTIQEILGYVDDTPTLLNCLLASRGFEYSTTRALYRSVTLHGKQLEAFRSAIDTNPHCAAQSLPKLELHPLQAIESQDAEHACHELAMGGLPGVSRTLVAPHSGKADHPHLTRRFVAFNTYPGVPGRAGAYGDCLPGMLPYDGTACTAQGDGIPEAAFDNVAARSDHQASSSWIAGGRVAHQ